jgi:hypothetical protein
MCRFSVSLGFGEELPEFQEWWLLDGDSSHGSACVKRASVGMQQGHGSRVCRWRIPSQRRWGVRYLVTLNTCTTCSLLPRRRRNGRPFSPSLTPADYPAGCLPCPVAPCDGH